ncbi:MAG: hypothetical protein KAS16_04615 [Thermoplasmata archaeon]|nr:hypothetical protein [Thermoplasmata archaeon]
MKAQYLAQIVIALLLLSSLGFGSFANAPRPDIEIVENGTRSVAFHSYHGYDAMVSVINDLVSEYPDIASLHDLGDTSQGRDILAVKISDDVDTDDATEPDILYMGAHHGNEPISVEVPLYLLEFLLTNYGINGTVTKWVDTREIWIVPMVNPDGIEAGTRKNANGTGVDINRNYDQNWGTQGTSTNPSDTIYCGQYAFSEAESKAIRDLAIDQRFELSMSFHSYGQLVYYPWGNSIETISASEGLLIDIGSEIAERNGYHPTEGNEDGAYLTSGDSDDWLYTKGTLPFTIELSTVFQPPENQILGICERNLDSSLYLLDIADLPEVSSLPDWTFMVYMAGDNSLSSAALKDLNEMEVGGSSQDINIIALFDGSTDGDSKIYRVDKDPDGLNTQIISTVIDDQGSVIDPATNEADMSSSKVLEDFVDWTMARYPAQNTALIIWDHGDGLLGGLARDGTTWMPTWEMRKALAGYHIDVVGTDLCWHGNLENAYELRGLADFYVGSIAEEPSDGWDYAAISEYLTNEPNTHPRELSREIVRTYKAATISTPYATLSSIDLYQMEKNFLPIFNEFAICIRDHMYRDQAKIRTARSMASIFDIGEPYFIDLGEFLESLIAADTSQPLNDRAISLSHQLDMMILESHAGIQYPDISGIGIYLPDRIYDNRYHTELRFEATSWDEFLSVFRIPIQTPEISHDPAIDVYESNSTIHFNVTINDDGLDSDSLFLYHRPVGGTWTQTSLTGSGNSYSGQASSQAGVNEIEYYFSATDLGDNTITLPYGVKLGSSDLFVHVLENAMVVEIRSIDHYPNTNITAGDNITITIQIENTGMVEVLGANVSLFLVVDGTQNVIDSSLQNIQPGEIKNISFMWLAVEGNYTILATLEFGDVHRDIAIDLEVQGSAYVDPNLNDQIEEELNQLWLGVIIMFAAASAISMGALFIGKSRIRQKKKALAYKAVDNASYYVNSFADFGAEVQVASWKLEKAREALEEKKYDSAYNLALEAKKSVDTFNTGPKNNSGEI